MARAQLKTRPQASGLRLQALHFSAMSVVGVPAGTLPRRLGGWSVVGLVIGITIGSGIFRTPASIAQRVGDPWWILLVWSAGGVISICGALSVAELAASLPRTGGWYLYLREGWG